MIIIKTYLLTVDLNSVCIYIKIEAKGQFVPARCSKGAKDSAGKDPASFI